MAFQGWWFSSRLGLQISPVQGICICGAGGNRTADRLLSPSQVRGHSASSEAIFEWPTVSAKVPELPTFRAVSRLFATFATTGRRRRRAPAVRRTSCLSSVLAPQQSVAVVADGDTLTSCQSVLSREHSTRSIPRFDRRRSDWQRDSMTILRLERSSVRCSAMSLVESASS